VSLPGGWEQRVEEGSKEDRTKRKGRKKERNVGIRKKCKTRETTKGGNNEQSNKK
jgi:hypothetical protein